MSTKFEYTRCPKQILNTNREFTSSEYMGVMDGDINGGGNGYLTNKTEAPNTNRQFFTKN